ncbi:MAG: hypothetical protein ACI9VR_003016 [Cognaticolwellia sp.]|jgi:hypothetical protein
MLTLTLAFLACSDNSENQDSDFGPVDTQPVDTGSPPQGIWPVTVVSEDLEITAGVFEFALAEGGISDVEMLVSADLSQGSVTFELSAPDIAELQVLDSGVPAVNVRYALVLSFADDNANGSHDTGEAFVGGLDYGLMYVENPTAVMEFLGFRNGWNAFRTQGSFTEIADLQGLVLRPNLGAVETMELSGSYDENYGPARAAVLPVGWFSDPDFSQVLVDVALGSSWTMLLEGAPPSSHLLPSDDPLLPGGALDLPFAYLDNNGNGKWTLGQDQPVLPACYGGAPALAVWLPEPPTVQAALSYLGAGIAPGWVLAQQSKTGLDFLGVEAYGGLSFSADCGF